MSDNNESESNQNTNTSPRGPSAAVAHMLSNKVNVALWITRLLTIFFSISYILPIFWVNPYTSYQRALISNAATSALRLHQRLPNVQLTREFFALLLLEDSCHYLFYSIIFLNAYPITMVLLPVALFALLHSASYTLTLLDLVGHTGWWGARLLISIVEYQQRNILRLVAFTEIFLMVFSISLIFFGKMNLLIPFIYYRFLQLRYSSRRNPYSRQMFYELRLVIEFQVNKPGCPVGVRSVAQKMIAFISRLAPAVPQ